MLYLCCQENRPGQASGKHVNAIVAGLRERGWRVELLEPRHRQAGSPFVRLATIMLFQLRAISRIHQADALYVRAHPLALASWVARLFGVPVVQEINGPADDLIDIWPAARPFARVLRRLFRRHIRWSQLAIGVTPQLAAWARELGASAVAVVPNGVDTDAFTPNASLPSMQLPRDFVVFVGTLAPWQGLPTLLEAASSPSWPRNVALVIVGSGPMRTLVGDAAARFDHILALGQVQESDVPGIVARAIASLVPAAGGGRSTDGGGTYAFGLSPLKAFEAMSSGTPVIASDQPELGDLIERAECGLVVPINDAEALARAVRSLADNPEQAAEMGKRGRAEALAHHDWTRRGEETERLVRQVVEQSTK